jgi:hypothetical protein
LQQTNRVKDLFKDVDPEKQNKYVKSLKSVAGGAGMVANSVFRTFVPVGSLKANDEKEQFIEEYKRHNKGSTLTPLGQMVMGGAKNKLKQGLKQAGVVDVDKIRSGAQSFDERVSNFKNQIRDKIGGNFDKPLDKAYQALHPMNLIDKNYVSRELSSPVREKEQKAIYTAMLRNFGALDNVYKQALKNDPSLGDLTDNVKKKIEASLSTDDIKMLLKESVPQDKLVAKLKELDEKHGTQLGYSMLDHYQSKMRPGIK